MLLIEVVINMLEPFKLIYHKGEKSFKNTPEKIEIFQMVANKITQNYNIPVTGNLLFVIIFYYLLLFIIFYFKLH